MVRNVEWLNENEGRRYPLRENSKVNLKDAEGGDLGLDLPNSIILDIILTVPSDIKDVYLSSVVYNERKLELSFSDNNNANICGTSVDIDGHEYGNYYLISGLSSFFDIRGWVNIGNLDELSNVLPYGVYYLDSAYLEPRCVRQSLLGVRSLQTDSLGIKSSSIFGDVKLLAGANIRLDYDAKVNGIWIHADPNSGYIEECECEDPVLSNVVRTINGLPIENVSITGDGECVEVEIQGNAIVIRDTCSEPCCGCEELDLITATYQNAEASLQTLTTNVTLLEQKLADFINKFVTTISY